MQFNELYQKYRRQMKWSFFQGKLIALDPGETTGWVEMDVDENHKVSLVECGQLPCAPIEAGIKTMGKFLITRKPDFLVFEQYRVYSFKSQTHSWSELHTPKLIGSILTTALMCDIPYKDQMAIEAKGFCTDDKLRQWGYYQKGQKHARDAIRHATYFLMFNKVKLPVHLISGLP